MGLDQYDDWELVAKEFDDFVRETEVDCSG
jgi:hypothetical protein